MCLSGRGCTRTHTIVRKVFLFFVVFHTFAKVSTLFLSVVILRSGTGLFFLLLFSFFFLVSFYFILFFI